MKIIERDDRPKKFSGTVARDIGISNTHLLRLVREGSIPAPEDQLPLPSGDVLMLWLPEEVEKAKLAFAEHRCKWLASRMLDSHELYDWNKIREVLSETQPGRKVLAAHDKLLAELKKKAEQLEHARDGQPSVAEVMSGEAKQ